MSIEERPTATKSKQGDDDDDNNDNDASNLDQEKGRWSEILLIFAVGGSCKSCQFSSPPSFSMPNVIDVDAVAVATSQLPKSFFAQIGEQRLLSQ